MTSTDIYTQWAAKAQQVEFFINSGLREIRDGGLAEDVPVLAEAVHAALSEHPETRAGAECDCGHLAPCPTRRAVATALGWTGSAV